MDQEQQNGQQQQSVEPPTGDIQRSLLWAGGVLVALAFLLTVICGYLFGWKWTGLVADANYPKKTLWDWLDLLIVPAVLAIGGYLFTRFENQRTRQSAEAQRELDREIAEQRTSEDRKLAQERADTDRGIAEERRQDDTLQRYLDKIAQLLLDQNRPLRQSKEGVEERTLARAQTLTVLPRLDSDRKASVMQFLYESGLLTKDVAIIDLEGADLRGAGLVTASLSGANLIEVKLTGAYLSGANLRGAYLMGAQMSGTLQSAADLSGADMRGVFMRNARLGNTDLIGTNLNGADLNGADLEETHLDGADLDGATLRRANLAKTTLSRANLNGADLTDANLGDAKGVTKQQLQAAKSLEGTRMPDGQRLRGGETTNGPTFEEWLKDRESRKEDAENK